MRFATYTGGGPAPGLNAAIWTIIQESKKNGVELIGFLNGAQGILDRKFITLSEKSEIPEKIERTLYLKGGTYLGTSRLNPEEEIDKFKAILKELEIDGLITIGGDDTARAGSTFQSAGIPTNHVAKTIDNDVWGTDKTFGYETVVTLGREAANALAEDASSTGGIYVSEVMGRGAGHITFGIFEGSAASVALIPEVNFDIEKLKEYLQDKNGIVVLVAEGAYDKKLAEGYTKEREEIREILTRQGISKDLINKHFPVPERDDFGNVKKGGVAKMIVAELIQYFKKENIKKRIRQTPDLGYQYRCADPITADVQLAQRMARFAFDNLLEGLNGTPIEGENVGVMGALKGNDIKPYPLKNVVKKTRVVPKELYEPYLAEGGLLIHY